ncbi:transcriptional regulator [Limosilactobacillus coleohominis DSM 14060]|nr:transcriptional regulator [Limosilactobacillus coleohominis DSM 14060]
MKFSTQIKMQRKKRGLTQSVVAKNLYVTRQTISNWEQGKSYPDLNTLVKISDFYQISIDSLLREDQDLQEFLEQGKAYNAFSIFRGLFFIMYGIFFLMFDYINDSSPIIDVCAILFVIVFGVAILYGEHVKPFFLGISKERYYHEGIIQCYQKSSFIGKGFFLLASIIVISMVILRKTDYSNYLAPTLFVLIGMMDILHRYMWKPNSVAGE